MTLSQTAFHAIKAKQSTLVTQLSGWKRGNLNPALLNPNLLSPPSVIQTSPAQQSLKKACS